MDGLHFSPLLLKALILVSPPRRTLLRLLLSGPSEGLSGLQLLPGLQLSSMSRSCGQEGLGGAGVIPVCIRGVIPTYIPGARVVPCIHPRSDPCIHPRSRGDPCIHPRSDPCVHPRARGDLHCTGKCCAVVNCRKLLQSASKSHLEVLLRCGACRCDPPGP